MYQIFINFIIFSFLGWLCEVIYCSIGNKKLVNRGMLYGPICPIYGFGGVLITYGLSYFKNNFVVLFIFSFIGCSIIEYFTSFILEKIFDLKLWDYQDKKYNINGRVCLLNSSLFGLLSLLLIYVVNPYLILPLNKFISNYIVLVFIILVSIFVVDLICTLISICHLNNIILYEKKIFELKKHDNRHLNRFSHYIFSHFKNKFPKIRSIKNRKFFESLKEKYEKIKNKLNKD